MTNNKKQLSKPTATQGQQRFSVSIWDEELSYFSTIILSKRYVFCFKYITGNVQGALFEPRASPSDIFASSLAHRLFFCLRRNAKFAYYNLYYINRNKSQYRSHFARDSLVSL